MNNSTFSNTVKHQNYSNFYFQTLELIDAYNKYNQEKSNPLSAVWEKLLRDTGIGML